MTVAALCESVRDYAIFIMNPEGIIVYWGMGSHLMKWWTPEEAEGAHLRLLYPENGSEDGTAEQHLFQAATAGEYVGEGQRVRRDGSTFWAHVTLTALRDPEGRLLCFAKVTQDVSRRRAIEAAVALANDAQTTVDACMKTLWRRDA
ncbi:MAG TPA: PAS domain S-box protein [Caldimonas sp.]|nr:PAS domain S-box protein [Caldimonas sp.]HEX2542879.1 PAS domain S-box protein [Caldimonas sp.]